MFIHLHQSRRILRRPTRLPRLDLHWAVPKAAASALAPSKDGAVSGEGDAVVCSSWHSDDALASQGLELLGQLLVPLRATVAQLAILAIAPPPDGAVASAAMARLW